MKRLWPQNLDSRLWAVVSVGLVYLAFALKALLLIDATSLWSDELYSVGKSFQPDFGALLAMLREDTHPLLYYALLWLCGSLVGQSPISLRLLSRLAYALGAGVMVAQAGMVFSALKDADAPPFTRVLQCQSPTNGPGAG